MLGLYLESTEHTWPIAGAQLIFPERMGLTMSFQPSYTVVLAAQGGTTQTDKLLSIQTPGLPLGGDATW